MVVICLVGWHSGKGDSVEGELRGRMDGEWISLDCDEGGRSGSRRSRISVYSSSVVGPFLVCWSSMTLFAVSGAGHGGSWPRCLRPPAVGLKTQQKRSSMPETGEETLGTLWQE